MQRQTLRSGDTRRGTDTFLYNNGPVETLDDENLLFRQTYDLLEIRDGKVKVLLENQLAAPSNVGPASMPTTRASSTRRRSATDPARRSPARPMTRSS